MKFKIITVILFALLLSLAVSCNSNDTPEVTDNDVIESTAVESTAVETTAVETTATEITTETEIEESTQEEITTMTYAEQAEAVRTLLTIPDGKSVLTVFGDKTADESTLSELNNEIKKLEDNGHMVSFIIADINGNFGLAYNCDKKWTSQSTIKAPYLTSVLMKDDTVFAKQKKLYKAVITVSDNDAYAELRDIYGNTPFKNFCKLAGISQKHTTDLYPRSITVRDMAKLWTVMYEFLNTRDDLQEYISYFTGTAMSCVYQGLGNKYKVQTKAGWESGTDYDGPGGTPDPRYTDGDPSNDEIATNDTGIVYAGEHPYIIAIFTNLQSDPESLIPLVRAIDNAHSALVK